MPDNTDRTEPRTEGNETALVDSPGTGPETSPSTSAPTARLDSASPSLAATERDDDPVPQTRGLDGGASSPSATQGAFRGEKSPPTRLTSDSHPDTSATPAMVGSGVRIGTRSRPPASSSLASSFLIGTSLKKSSAGAEWARFGS